VQRLGQALDHIAGLVNLAALDWRMPTEGRAQHLGKRLRAVNDEQSANPGIETAFDQIVDECLYDGRVLGRSFDEAKRMFVAFAVDTKAPTRTRSLPMCRPSIWITGRSSCERSEAIHSAMRSADSATNRREAADFDVPSPVTA
jgi:hypothetical protein